MAAVSEKVEPRGYGRLTSNEDTPPLYLPSVGASRLQASHSAADRPLILSSDKPFSSSSGIGANRSRRDSSDDELNFGPMRSRIAVSGDCTEGEML